MKMIGATNLAGLAITAAIKSEVITDLCGTGSIGLSAWLLHRSSSGGARATLSTAAIVIWSAKLASFLALRAFMDGDKRLQAFLPPPGEGWMGNGDRLLKLAGFWALQAVWGMTMLAPQVASLPYAGKVPLWQGWLGLAVAGTGLLVETVADVHKFVHKRAGGELLTTGLYGVVRYPNYTGEILFWGGLGLYYWHSFGSAPLWPRALAFLPAAFITLLLIKVSGIPLTEASRRRHYKQSAEYAAYVARVPWLLFPKIY